MGSEPGSCCATSQAGGVGVSEKLGIRQWSVVSGETGELVERNVMLRALKKTDRERAMNSLPSTSARQILPTAHCPLPNAYRLRRSGTTLVEMLIVMSVAAVMMGVSVCAIHLLLDAEREATRAVRFNTSVARLAQAFRADIHAARQVELPDAEDGMPAVLVASLDGRQIRYELDAHQATRIETEGEHQVHREAYYFPPRSLLQFWRRPGEKGLAQEIVVLEIDMAPAGSGTREIPSATHGSPKRRLTVEAVPGRDHRFEKQP